MPLPEVSWTANDVLDMLHELVEWDRRSATTLSSSAFAGDFWKAVVERLRFGKLGPGLMQLQVTNRTFENKSKSKTEAQVESIALRTGGMPTDDV